jgi:Ca2+-binding RTX toxin-like protein
MCIETCAEGWGPLWWAAELQRQEPAMQKPSYGPWEAAKQLDSGHHWPDPVVTYSFPGWNDIPGFSAFSYDQQVLAELVLDLWSDVINITFKVSYFADDADIRFMNSSELPAGVGGATGDYPGSDPEDGDVYINSSNANNADMSFGGGAMLTLLHEVGHALGLSHPGDYNFADAPTYEEDAEYIEDTNQYTVMSYFAAEYTGALHETAQGVVYAQTPLLHDIYAIQQIYGTNLNTRAGDTVYGFNSTADRDVFDFDLNLFPVIAIWDGGGIDTLDLSGYRSASRVDLAAGAFSDVAGLTKNVAIAYKTYIENAIGGDGNDSIVGNEFENTLRGGDGNDELYGEQSDFWLGYAWAGAPLYVLDDADKLYGGEGRDTLRGGWGDDLLHGDAGVDDLNGGAGGDELNGGAGDDILVGDAGADEIHGGSGDDEIYGHRHKDAPVDKLNDPNWAYEDADYLYGGDGGDTIYGGYGDDWIWGDGGQGDDGEVVHGAVYSGDDYLYGEEGSDFIDGGEGRDFLDGGDGVDYLYGQNGNDYLVGDEGNDQLGGGSGHDRLTGQSGEDTLRGEDGNDWFDGGSERDTFYGGAGTDMLSYFGDTDRWEVDLASGFAINLDANYDEILASIENLELGMGNDIAYGTDGANVIWGWAGNDTIRGRNGHDTLHGHDGVDFLYGGAGNDMLHPDANNALNPDGDNDFVFGDGGIDTVSYGSAAESVTVDLAGGWAMGDDIGFDLLSGVESATGGRGDDYLYGDGAANRLEGFDGNDVLHGRGGNDHLLGWAGDDLIRPGPGNDTVDGGADNDTVSYSDSALSWLVDLSGGYASAGLGSYQTLIDIEDVALGTGNDVAYGTSGDNAIGGNDGNDWLYGGDGGNDRLYGGDGNDTLYGGSGEDFLEGGDGDDVFSFDDESQLTTVADFVDGSDRIGLNMTDYVSFDDLAIEPDADGNAVIYMGPRQITLVGVSIASLDNSDFIWL